MSQNVLESFGPGIWTASAPLKLAGVAIGTRMTVVRVGEDWLILIAPVPIDEELAAALAAEGRVAAIIAPNTFHHFYLLDALRRYPEARCFLAPGVDKKIGTRPEGAVDLRDEADGLWQADLEQVAISGAPATNEVVFYHGASRTLILTDLCFNFDPAPGGWAGVFLRIAGAHGRMAVSRLMRALLKDRTEVRASVARILDWDFDRIIVTHGHNTSDNAQEKFRLAASDL